MSAEPDAVDPRRGHPVGGADDEEDALAPPALGHLDGPLVPADVGAVGHPGQCRAPGEGDENRPRVAEGRPLPSRFLSRIPRVEAEAPRSVEVLPVGALEVRTRMFGKGY